MVIMASLFLLVPHPMKYIKISSLETMDMV